MRNAWVHSGDAPSASLRTVARIKKPAAPAAKNSTKFSKQIRDDILRGEFGYTDAGVAAFNAQYPNSWVIEDNKYPNKWATDEQIKNAKVEADGLIAIVLEEPWVKAVQDFLTQRASFEAFKVGLFITDADVRKQITDILEAILSSAGDKRITALDNLMIAISGSPTAREEIFRALSFLANESGYKNNPFLLIAMARARIYKSDMLAWGSAATEQTLIFNATKSANENLLWNRSQSALSKISKTEAARINHWASSLYNESGAQDKAIQREWIERYLTISDEERATLNIGDVIEFYAPSVTVMEAPSEYAQKLMNLEKDRAKRLQQEKDIAKIGNPNPPNDPRDRDYYWKPTDRVEMNNALVQQKDRHLKDGGKRPKFKTVNLSVPVNQIGYTGDKINPSLTIIAEILKYIAADRRMSELADYHKKKDYILKQLDKEQRQKMRVVPPKPGTILKAMEKVRRYGVSTVDPAMKAKIPQALRELEIMLEESYVYYK